MKWTYRIKSFLCIRHHHNARFALILSFVIATFLNAAACSPKNHLKANKTCPNDKTLSSLFEMTYTHNALAQKNIKLLRHKYPQCEDLIYLEKLSIEVADEEVVTTSPQPSID